LSFEFNYRVLSGRLEIKEIGGNDHSMNQKLHLALGMPISKMAHVDREREKHTCKITSRQNLSN
jgi:hypothetical protein